LLSKEIIAIKWQKFGVFLRQKKNRKVYFARAVIFVVAQT
jgi:hypothetical protein